MEALKGPSLDGRHVSGRLIRNVVILIVVALLLAMFWPFRTVPTGSRGVLTQFGAIKQIEPEGLVIVAPWQRLALFSIRAEQAQIDNADGSTSDTQPVKVSLTVRYLSLIHISEPTRLLSISYAVFCLSARLMSADTCERFAMRSGAV